FFVAGAGSMNYKRFISYNVIGGFLWITSFVLLGYFFGNQPVIKDNFTYVIFSIIGFSVLPIVINFIKQKIKPMA
ncbi:MAG: cytochrome O ubiquinol oxidase, partial [Moraxella sp.]|nr:cytochrome O ubiquinol oxidase [Moraxella sp.]